MNKKVSTALYDDVIERVELFSRSDCRFDKNRYDTIVAEAPSAPEWFAVGVGLTAADHKLLTYNGEEICNGPMARGNCMLLTGEADCYVESTPHEYLAMRIKRTSFDDVLDRLSITRPASVSLIPRMNVVDPLLAAILREFALADEAQKASQLYVDTIVQFVCLHLAYNHSHPLTSSLQLANDLDFGNESKLVKRITGYLEENLAKDISLAELVTEFDISQSRLIRLFNRVTGNSPYQFLRERRLGRAANMLHSTDASIHEIRTSVGFRSDSAFAAAFRRRYGLSPRAFRQKK